jgi:hypothetical protein
VQLVQHEWGTRENHPYQTNIAERSRVAHPISRSGILLKAIAEKMANAIDPMNA